MIFLNFLGVFKKKFQFSRPYKKKYSKILDRKISGYGSDLDPGLFYLDFLHHFE